MLFLASSGAHASGAHPSAHVSVAEPAAHIAPAPRSASAPVAEPVPAARPAIVVPHHYHYKNCTEAEKKDKRHHCK